MNAFNENPHGIATTFNAEPASIKLVVQIESDPFYNCIDSNRYPTPFNGQVSHMQTFRLRPRRPVCHSLFYLMLQAALAI
jgi:hypothetical protein